MIKVCLKVALLNILNGLDCIFTILCVTSGEAVEVNPIMAYFLDIHPLVFVAVKLGLVIPFSVFLLYLSERLWVRRSIDMLLLVYSLIIVYQIIFRILV
jgi:hypothetical protein